MNLLVAAAAAECFSKKIHFGIEGLPFLFTCLLRSGAPRRCFCYLCLKECIAKIDSFSLYEDNVSCGGW